MKKVFLFLLSLLLLIPFASAVTDMEYWFNNSLLDETGNYSWIKRAGDDLFVTDQMYNPASAISFVDEGKYRANATYEVIHSGDSFVGEIIALCNASVDYDVPFALDYGNDVLMPYTLGANGSGTVFFRDGNANVKSFYYDAGFDDGNWRYVVVQRNMDLSTFEVYIDGVIAYNVSIGSATGPLYIEYVTNIALGSNPALAYGAYTCAISYLRVASNEYMTALEVEARYNSSQPPGTINITTAVFDLFDVEVFNYSLTTSYEHRELSTWVQGFGGSHDVVFNKTGYYNFTQNYSSYNNFTLNISGVHDSLLNISAVDMFGGSVQNFSGWVYHNSTGYNESFVTNSSNALVPIMRNDTYVVFIGPPYAYFTNYSVVVGDVSMLYMTAYLNAANSVNVSVFDEGNASLISWENITLILNSPSSASEYVTTNGTFFLENVENGTNVLQVYGDTYGQRLYTVTVTPYSHQTINVYLATVTQNVTFLLRDRDTNLEVVGAVVTMERYIGGSWTVMTSKESDITGSIFFNYIPNTNYRFTITHDDYVTRQFQLFPIIYSSYTVLLTASEGVTTPAQFAGVSVSYAPGSFYADRQNNVSVLFSSPEGLLLLYNYSYVYPGGSVSGSGVNAYGGSFTNNFNISGAVIGDVVNFTYTYETGLSGVRTFSRSYYVVINASSGTLMGLRDHTYGMGLYERVLLATFIVILVGGFMAFSIGVLPGVASGMFIMSVLSYVGFVPLWTLLIVLTIGLIILASKGGST